MKKRLLIVVAMIVLLVVVSVAAICDEHQLKQNLYVDAPYLLEKVSGNNLVTMAFTMNEYNTGYVKRPHAIRLRVGAPGPWTVNISATYYSGNTSVGVIGALWAIATGGNWVDVGISNQPLLAGSDRYRDFFVDYQVNAAELSGTQGQNISTTVMVT